MKLIWGSGKREKQLSDQQLIEQILAGGRNREAAIVQLHQANLGFITKSQKVLGIKREDALDVYTDAVLVVAERIQGGGFQLSGKLSTFLYRIFWNKCIDQRRKKSIHEVKEDWESMFSGMRTEEKDLLEQIIDLERFQLVMRQLESLGESCRQLIYLGKYLEYSPAELAEALGLANGKSASSRLHQCMGRLRKLLGLNN
ncbi:MAG: sigma-70 family RNA polymerase sigma factor [Bacteroidota bacterium]